jgi:hypothetical protein
MTIQADDKKTRLLHELNEELDKEGLLSTMHLLDKYTVAPPSAQATDNLIALLKPVLREQHVLTEAAVKKAWVPEYCKLPNVLHLVQPQTMLLSKWFIALSILVILVGLGITIAMDGNTVKFLANAAPVLGILTVLYEFRSKLSGVSELEAACPYSPAQLATARLIVVLSYDILLCLAVTPVVSYWQGHVLWQVVVSWLAPLLLMLGIALSVSIRFGITGGCLVAATVWTFRLTAAYSNSVFSFLLSRQSADLISLAVGVGLLLYAYKRWHLQWVLSGDD